MESYIRFILRHRLAVIALLLAVTTAAAASMSQGVISSSIAGLFLAEHPDYPRYLKRAGSFGSDDIIVVAVQDDQLLSARSQRRFRGAVRRIRELPTVSDVRSLLQVQRVRGGEESLQVETYAQLALEQPGRRAALLAELTRDPLARGLMVSADGGAAVVLVELDTDGDRAAERLPTTVAGVVAAFTAEGVPRGHLHLVGLPTTVGAIIEETYDNFKARFPIVLLVLLVTVWLLFHRLWPVLVTGLVSLLAVIWTMGFAVLLDRQISIFTSVVPGVILIISFSDVVHLCSAYLMELGSGKGKGAAILQAASEVGAACVFTSLTTLVGFLSLSSVPTPASRLLGVVLGFGAAMALLIAVTLSPILFSLLPNPGPWRTGATGRVQGLLDRLLAKVAALTSRRPLAVLLISALLAGGVMAGLTRLEIETDFAQRLSEEHPLRADGRFFERNFAGSNTLLVYLRTQQEQGLLQGERLAAVARYQAALEALPEVDRVTSLVDLMGTLHQALLPEDPGALPLAEGALAQYLLLFEMSGGESLDRLVDFHRREMVLRVQLGRQEFRHTARVGNAARALATRQLATVGVEAEPSGLVYMLGQFFSVILHSQQRALLVVFAIIALMMVIGLRSLRAGLWSMIPNLLPLFFVGGYLGWVWEYADSDVLMVAIIAIGIGVDDTIHFLMRLRIESRRLDPATGERTRLEQAIRRTFAFSGRGIMMTTIILSLGFMPFALSSYLPIHILGTLLPLTLVVALLADLLVIPALARLGFIRFHDDI